MKTRNHRKFEMIRSGFFAGHVLLTSVGILSFSTSVFGASNQSLVYQGRILRPDGAVPNTGTITFNLSVYSPAPKKCLLYSESQSVNMTGSAGMFSLSLGLGTRTDSGAHSFDKVFVNGGSLTGLSCADGSTSYTPTATDDRNLVAAFNDNGTVVTLSAMEIKSIPFALQAQQISGYGINDIVKIHPTTGSATTFTTAEMAIAKTITGLSCAVNEVIKWSGTAWACSSDATGGSPSDASYLAKGIAQFDTNAATSGLSVASGVVKLSDVNSNVGSFGSATKTVTLTVNAHGRITAASHQDIAIPASQITQSSASTGEVLKWNGAAWAPAADAGTTTDASYAAKGIVQFDTDAATSGVSVTSGVAKVNTGVGAYQIVKLDGTGKLPAVDGSALTNITATGYSGVLPIANGGTNSSTGLNNDRIMVSASGKIVEAGAMTNGQLLIGSTGAAPTVATVGSSNGISITTGAGSLSIATNATPNNTASTIVSRDASGNFAAGAVTNTSNVLKGATSGQLTMTVPGTVTSYTLTWPAAVGGAGSFLTTDASGNLSWGSPAAVADASYAAKGAVQGLTDAAISGLNISSGVISVNAGTAANQIVKLNGSAQIPAVDGSLLTNLSAANLSGTVPINKGGTGQTTKAASFDALSPLTTKGDVLVHDGTNNFRLPAGTNNYVLTADSTQTSGLKWAAAPTPGDASYAGKGIFQADTDAATSGLVFSGAGVLKVNVGTGADQIIKLDGSSKLPAVDGSALTNLSANNIASGTLPISRGGTNSGTALNNNRIMFSSTGAIVEMAELQDGQIIVGDTGGAPTVATLGSSGGITVTSGAGSLSIGSTATSANTASAIVSRDASGNFAAGAVTNTSNILKGSTVGNLTMTVPASVTSYTLTWPSAVGSAGSFLTTDASGNLSWGSPAAIADSSYAAKGAVQFDTDAATSGISVASGVAKINTGTAANQIVKLNGSAQLPAVDGSLLTNLSAGNIASGVLPIARGGTNNGSLAVTAGGILYTDGSKLMNTGAGTSGQALISAAAGAPVFGTLGVGGGGTGQTSFAANSLIMANGTGSQLTGMTCAPGQILKWNAGDTAWECASDATGTSPGDASYAAKGLVQGLTDAATSGIVISSGVISVNSGTGASQIVKLDGSSRLPAVDGSALTNLSAASIGAGVLPIARGGTNNGALAITDGGIVYADGTSLQTTAAGTTGQAFISQGAGIPTWGTLSVAGGGTGNNANFSANALIMANGTGLALTSMTCSVGEILKWNSTAWVCSTGAGAIADAAYTSANKGVVAFDTDAATSGVSVTSGVAKINTGTAANQILKLDGSARIPAVDGSLLTNLSAANVTGTLPVANGGTGVSSFTAGDLMYASGATAISKLGIGGSGTVLTSSGTAPQWSSIGSLGFFADGGNTVTATATLGTNSNHKLEIETNGTTKMTIEAGGNVGIGTQTPNSRLAVVSANSNAISLADVTTDATNKGAAITGSRKINANTPFAGFATWDDGIRRKAYVGGGSWNLPDATQIGFYTAPAYNETTNQAVERMTIQSDGDIGIGVADPTAKLEVQGQIVSKENIVASGATADFVTGNTQILQSVGGSTITLDNMVNGGQYTVIVEDTTARTYSFGNCATTRAVPALATTTGRSVFTIIKASTACYITWITGF